MAKAKNSSSSRSSSYSQAKGRSSGGSKRPPNKKNISSPQKGPIAVAISIVVIVAIVATLILVKLNSGSSSAFTAKPVPHAVAAAVTGVPQGVLSQAGYSSAIPLTQAITSKTTPLTLNGKPEVLYIGADYCPFCAAERWPVIAALSKFGTFSNLHLMSSSSSDSFPNTSTFSFYNSHYSSPYISFVGDEWATNQSTTSSQNFSGYSLLQVPSAANQKLFSTYDNAPYTSTSGSIPFVDFGNKYIQIGASYSPSILAGLSWDSIAGSLSLPTSATGKAIDQTANVLIATICKLTKDQPASACQTSTIKSLTSQIGG